MIYTLVLQFYLKELEKEKKKMIPFWRKKTAKQCYNNDIYRWKKDSFSSEENYRGNCLNNCIKKENFKKVLINLIQTNHQINMTPDHSVSTNNSFKNHLNDKSFWYVFNTVAVAQSMVIQEKTEKNPHHQ